MQTIIGTLGVLTLAWGLGFAGMALWTQAYLRPHRWGGFLRCAAGGSLCGLLVLGVLVRTVGGGWRDVVLAAASVAAVLLLCWGLVAVFDR